MSKLNSPKIKSMRTAGQILASTFDHISEFIVEGISAGQVDDVIDNLKQQISNYTEIQLLKAINHYWANDSFILLPSA